MFALTLNDLREEIGECELCSLCKSRTRLVFGDGNDEASLLFVGEAPGRAEDAQGLPFVGPAGKLLDTLLDGIGLKRSDVYITNVVKCRPPGNRDPYPEEIEACNPFLRSQLSIIKPKIVCALGRIAASALLGKNVQMTRMHGQKFPMPGFFLVPVYHPAAALRNPATVKVIEEDFGLLRMYLNEDEEPPPGESQTEPEQMGLF